MTDTFVVTFSELGPRKGLESGNWLSPQENHYFHSVFMGEGRCLAEKRKENMMVPSRVSIYKDKIAKSNSNKTFSHRLP